MAFANNLADSLTVPGGAGPNDPQIVVGSQIPQELIDRYLPNSISAAIIKRIDANRYTYQAVIQDITGGGGASKEAFGIVNLARTAPGTSKIAELWTVDYGIGLTVPRITYGSDLLGEDQPALVFPSSKTLLSGLGWQINGQGEGKFKQLYQNTTPVIPAYFPDAAAATANVLIGNANTSITGAIVNVAPAGTADLYIVSGHFSVTAVAVPTGQFQGLLLVDGAARPGVAGPVKFSNNGDSTMVTRQWRVTGLSAGPHTFQLAGIAGTAAQYQVNTVNTAIFQNGYYGGQ